jgi:hypothetical protein
MTTTPQDLPALACAVFPTNRFLFILGQGGSGKTSIACNEIASSTGRECWLVNLCGQGPQEVIGYGIPQPNGDMRFSAPTIWPTEERVGNKPVLLVLDELPDYDPEVRALLRGLYPASGARYVGPHKLGSNVAVVVTGNRRGDGTRSAVEDAPFTERCVKVTLEPTVGDWLDWYDTQPALTASGSHVPAFLRFGSTSGDGLDHFNPPVKQPYDGMPHPCPRTWEAVALLSPLRKTQPQVFRTAVCGSVGDRAAAAFFGFLTHVDRLPDIAAIKSAPDGFDVPFDPAEQYALVSACLATATRGITDLPAAVHAGAFDWLCSLLLRCRGDIQSYGARSAVRRGIPLDQHHLGTQLLLD